MNLANRIDNPAQLDKTLIESKLVDGKPVILQFSDKTFTDETLKDIDNLCAENSLDLTIRFYGFYFDVFDCAIVEKIPHVKSLSIDCLTNAFNIESIKKLEHLEKLSIGIYNLKDTELLASDNFKKLKELLISESKTKAFNLEYLKEFKNLSQLGIAGHTKNIEVVGELRQLETLCLSRISKVSVEFVNNLKELKNLSFILGGRENLDELEENEIEKLEIIWVRGFNEFSNLTKFRNLKSLTIEDQIRLIELNIDKPMKNLETLKLVNCKNFTTIGQIENLTSLKELRVCKTNIDFDKFIDQKFPEALKKFGFFTGKSKLNKEIQKKYPPKATTRVNTIQISCCA